MRICIDSNQFIFGISGVDADAERLMMLLPQLHVVLPRLVIKEVTRNLSTTNMKALYALLSRAQHVVIVNEPVPTTFVVRYLQLGLREKGDAFIGAFAEWQQVDCLISDNRHFLSELGNTTFAVLTPGLFLQRYSAESSLFEA